MSAPAPVFVYANLTALLAEIREPDRIGLHVRAYCPKTKCAWRWSSTPADAWNVGKKTPSGKPQVLRSYLRCGNCHSRLRHYQLGHPEVPVQ